MHSWDFIAGNVKDSAAGIRAKGRGSVRGACARRYLKFQNVSLIPLLPQRRGECKTSTHFVVRLVTGVLDRREQGKASCRGVGLGPWDCRCALVSKPNSKFVITGLGARFCRVYSR